MNETLKTIHSQRSTHGDFLPDGVSIADQETILAAAVRAPSASNRQAYSIIVVEDRGVMQELLGYQAGLALIFCNDTACWITRPMTVGMPNRRTPLDALGISTRRTGDG
jgi:nitroreductase